MPKGDFLGEFEIYVMLALAHLGPEAYGVSIRQEIERRTGRDVAIGAVYATLDRLEAKGLLRSRRTFAAGPSRRLFELTRVGARALTETRAMRERLWAGVSLTQLKGMA